MKTVLSEGDQYFDWKVINYEGIDDRRRRRYLCECKCGNRKSLVVASLVGGRTKRCSKCKVDDLTGRFFCDWEVLSRVENTPCGKSVWRCRCRCGKESDVLRGNLYYGRSKCCFDCGHKVIRDVIRVPQAWWVKAQRQAEIRKIPWQVTEKELIDLFDSQDGKCSLSKMPLSLKPMTASLDRVDSNQPYVISNLQWLFKDLNLMKGRHSQSKFIELCRLVAENAN